MLGQFAKIRIVLTLGAAALIPSLTCAAHAKTFQTLYSFGSGTDGWYPQSELLIDRSGNLYGTTTYGGDAQFGTVFILKPDGTESVLHNFSGDDGAYPYGAMTADDAGMLYGTTYQGGPANKGVVFRLSPDGTETTLHAFSKDSKGSELLGGLTLGKNGALFGTTYAGGRGDCVYNGLNGCGALFKLSNGKEEVLYSFLGGTADGAYPYGGVVRDGVGNLYGITLSGGIENPHQCLEPTAGCGTVFKLAADGTESILHYFAGGSDSACPTTQLIADSAGNLHGTTIGCGSTPVIFKISPDGQKFRRFTFAGSVTPDGKLLLDANGNLYGTAIGGGKYGYGMVFKIASNGKVTVLHDFTRQGSEGGNPQAGLTSDAEGNLYGTTTAGGLYGRGTVFELKK